ncbi:BglG family transcription antiterminator [Limosilactobacillus fermentum]|uniref:Ascorbate-specific PTS system EIIA component n=1 Tax=Limosilactobacillus fermentum TaxID=1613 RepID=A0ABD0ANK6_LIMFE|nr:PTS sugar transporter subunit IIA [Limosilactobacillus fermentum]MBD9349367.1 PRD domain-containing protein [Limosilactobacillus fermentum]PHI33555.1 hypothetical protein CEW18_06060 [Limosilactobacillus fermentum]GIC72557.1 PTS mannitol transporter subunit IIA [Limosilactobacillus fermentum]CDN26124.1 hypothetical protein LFER_1274 [Limosilactobacillus fermentum]
MIRFSNIKHGDALLSALASSGGFLPLSSLESQLKLSRRSIYYIIKRVNTELRTRDLFEISNVHGAGYALDQSTITALEAEDDHYPSVTTSVKIRNKLDAPYRRALILFVLITDRIASLNTLADQFSISKNTVINDLKSINDHLAQTNQPLSVVNTAKGKTIQGSEYDQRRWVFENNHVLFKSVLGEPYQTAKREFVTQQLNLLEKITGNSFTDESTQALIPFIQWYLTRLSLPNTHLKGFDDLGSSLTLTWAQSLLRDCHIDNQAECRYLSFIINTQPLTHVDVGNPLLTTLEPIAKKIVRNFEGLARVNLLSNNSKIVSDLAQHLVTTYYRVAYNINYKNPLLGQIRSMYQQTFSFTKVSIQPFIKFTNHEISDDEVSLITTYFSGALYNVDLLNRNQHTPSVMVVCSSGIGTSRLLLSNLSSHFPSVNFIGPFSTFQYENSDLSDVRLVISSVNVPAKNADIPVLVVPVIPTPDDWQTIADSLERNKIIGSSKSTITIDSLMDIVASYARIEDPDGLQQALSEYINQTNFQKAAPPTPSTELKARNNQFVSDHHDWLSAIHTSLSPLIKNDIISQQYEDTIINLTEAHGPYMAIGNGVMLAHAKPNEGVNELGVNFTLFKHPFNLAESGKLINLVIGLAPIDQHSHFEFLETLLKFIQNKDWINQLKAISSKEEFLQLLMDSKLA